MQRLVTQHDRFSHKAPYRASPFYLECALALPPEVGAIDRGVIARKCPDSLLTNKVRPIPKEYARNAAILSKISKIARHSRVDDVCGRKCAPSFIYQ